MFRKCIICGEGFHPRGPQKCCTKECMRENENRRRRVLPNEKLECAMCGTLFQPSKSGQVTCSKSCYGKSQYELKYEYYASRRKERSNSGYTKKYNDNYRELNKEIIKRQKMQHYSENSEEILARQKDWRDNTLMGQSRHKRYLEKPGNRQIKAESDAAYRKTTGGQTVRVKSYLKTQLNTTPPADLVDEVVALRILKRSIK